MIERAKLLDKIRALLSKTVGNGCSEHEALAALDKARAMMDAYEISEAELQLTKDTAAVLHRDSGVRDSHSIRRSLVTSVAHFCDCKAWLDGKALVFCGLPSDVQLATWLLDTLAAFVQAELANHLMGSLVPQGERRFIINGFVAGCTGRVSERLGELTERSKTTASSNGTALVVIKDAAVAEKMKEAGVNLRKGRRSRRRMDDDSYEAGKIAGNRASLGRPVSRSSHMALPATGEPVQ